jgi:hypothetical protein
VDGKTWTDVTPPKLPAHSNLRVVESSPHDAATAYVVVNAREERGPLILRTHDYGKSWQEIVNGLRENRRVNVVREDLGRKNLLFAGTDDGAYFSFDDGDHWQSLQLNLPNAPVSDLEIHRDDLVASTYGRSLWILDDITPLRQSDELKTNPTAFLLNPEKAVHFRWDVNQDTPLPPETPAGKNPPDGALIDYYLRTPASDLKMEIFDSSGKLVRSINSTGEPYDTAPANAPEYWFAKPTALPNRAGLNRYVWDLRYPAPKTLRYSYFDNLTDYIEYTYADHAIPGETPHTQPMGAMVPPGRYTIALTANGQTYRRQLEVALDPRMRASQSDLAEQLRVERIAKDALDVSYEAFAQTKAVLDVLQSQLKQMGADAQKSDEGKKLTDLEKKVGDIQSHEHTNLGFGPANRELARLFETISSSDARPAGPLTQSVEQTCRDVAKHIEEWRDFNSKELPQWNSTGQGSKLPAAEKIPAAPKCE